MMRYAIVIEKAASNYAAYVPDLPGCVATGSTSDRVRRNMQAAIELHLRGLFEDGLPPDYRSLVPRPEWAGPFRLVVPKLGGKAVKVFARASKLEKSQNDLVSKVANLR